MKNIKDIIILVFLLSILVITIFFRDNISNFILEKFIFKNNVTAIISNQYKLNYDFNYAKNTDDFYAKDKNQVINIFYSVLNSGTDEFYFYCQYDGCDKDINELASKNELVNINNFVHPFNSYRKINISINNLNKVSITIEKSYTADTIKAVDDKVNDIITSIIKDDMTIEDKIKTFHDYIINNSKYDIEYIDSGLNDIDNPSHKASGLLFYNKALCGGYADTMSIFLNKMNVKNYRISSEFHVWNIVEIDNNWYHLDLTWDDPITSNGSDVLLYTFFLINDEKLKSMNTGYHTYNELIYK